MTLAYIGNTQAGLLPGFPAVHKLFTLLFLFFLFFHMKSNFLPYNTAYRAVLKLLLCKLLSPLRLNIDIPSCFFTVSASLFMVGAVIFRLFFDPQTLGCGRTQPKRHIYEVIRSLALKEILCLLREQRCRRPDWEQTLHVRSRMFCPILLVDLLLEAEQYSSSFSKYLCPKWGRRAIRF